MLSDLFRSGFSREMILSLLLIIPTILISLTVHEYCHGYAAYRCGDMTARNLGRLTLNPVKHLDPIGTIMMLVFGFGYAKPVPINTRNFNNPKRDICIVSLAGPLSNIFLCFIGILLQKLSILIVEGTNIIQSESAVNFFFIWWMFSSTFITSNACLAVFNLLPIPPLDGSRLLSVVLPAKAAYFLSKYESYIMILILVLLYLGKLDGIVSFVGTAIIRLIDGLLSFIPFFN